MKRPFRFRAARRLTRPLAPLLASYARTHAAFERLKRLPVLSILVYHEVADAPHPCLPKSLALSTQRFRRELHWIKENFDILTLEEAVYRAPSGFKRHTVAICFDDGYRGVYDNAYRILCDYNIPATVFINGAFMRGEDLPLRMKLEWIADHVSWNVLRHHIPMVEDVQTLVHLNRKNLEANVERTIHQLCIDSGGQHLSHLYLNEAQLKSMDPALIHVGNHGYAHRWLAHLPLALQEDEILKGQAALERLPHKRPLFALPFGTPGSFDHHTLTLLKRYYNGLLLSAYGGWNARKSRRNGILHLYRNCVSNARPPLTELLWMNGFATWLSG